MSHGIARRLSLLDRYLTVWIFLAMGGEFSLKEDQIVRDGPRLERPAPPW